VDLLVSSIWWKKVWQMNRFSQKVIVISRNLEGFSLANHRRFPNSPNFLPAKLSRYTVCDEEHNWLTVIFLMTENLCSNLSRMVVFSLSFEKLFTLL